jgi:hypothetical protein
MPPEKTSDVAVEINNVYFSNGRSLLAIVLLIADMPHRSVAGDVAGDPDRQAFAAPEAPARNTNFGMKSLNALNSPGRSPAWKRP